MRKKLTVLTIGATASRITTITAHEIELFAEATGDTNPVHLDDAYAATTSFGRRIAHGMLSAGLISALLADKLPGPGSIYLSQSLKFKSPVYVGDTITATVEVTAYRASRRLATLKTTCTNQDGQTVLEGEALVMVPAQTDA
jgi:3-hydroxybutyryl-CoA dehydratase